MKVNGNQKKIILFVIVIIVVFAVVGGAVYFIENGFKKDRGTTSHQRITEQILTFDDDQYKVSHNIETYLLIGVDDQEKVDRPEQKPLQYDAEGNVLDEDGDPMFQEVETCAANDPNGYVGAMADFLLLLVMDRTENTYGFVQINRNTMTFVPMVDTEGNGDDEAFEQICIAHWYGGNEKMSCDNTVYTVSELCGQIKINGYYQIQMDAIAKLNHAVGGVEVTLEDDFTKQDPAMKEGATLTLTDEQAMIYVRARMDVGEGDNQARMNRQKQFMEGFRKKAFSMMESDAEFADGLLEQLESVSFTDLPTNTLSKLINQVYKSSYLGIHQTTGETKENDTFSDGVIHEEFYMDVKSLADIVALLCGVDYTAIDAYEDDEEEIDWEEYERLHGGEDYVEEDGKDDGIDDDSEAEVGIDEETEEEDDNEVMPTKKPTEAAEENK